MICVQLKYMADNEKTKALNLQVDVLKKKSSQVSTIMLWTLFCYTDVMLVLESI